MKRLSAFIILAALMLCVITFTSFSADLNEIVIFLDADRGLPVKEFENSKSICSEISFLADRDCEAYVVTVAYSDKNEKLIEGEPLIEKLKLTKGEEINYTTQAIDVTSASKVKVFVWEGFLNLKPIFNKPAILEKEATQEGWISKFVEAESNTSGNYTVLKDSELTAGELFEAAAGVNISDKYTDVIIETTEGTAVGEFIKNTSDWTAGVVKFAGEGTLKLTIQDYAECAPCEMYVDVINPFDRYEKVFENTDTYIYRAGNENTVKLLSLFETKAMEPAPVDLSVSINNLKGNAGGSFDAANNTIQFTGTGVVEITISDKYSNPESLMLEIVNAKNVTTYGELSSGKKGYVLLNDIVMLDGGKVWLSDKTLFGNGFTFDVTKGKNGDTEGGYDSGNGVVVVQNSTLDNVVIIGAIYTQYGGTSKSEYNFPAVLALGNSVIANSHISNCASPVRVANGSNIKIVNSTLEGGNFANLDIRGGTTTLENVTTINQSDADGNSISNSEGVIGLGIVVHSGSDVRIDIDGLTQYNCISKNTTFTASEAKTLKNTIFGSTYKDLRCADENEVEWVNTGILSMVEGVDESNYTPLSGYVGMKASIVGTNGYVYTKVPDADMISAKPEEYKSSAQYSIAPGYTFDYTTKNNIPQQSGSNDYCYYDTASKTYRVSFDEGESYNWEYDILTLTKDDINIDYNISVSPDAVINSDKTITLDAEGEYTVTYSYTDNNNYRLNNGAVQTYPVTYEKNIKIIVYEVVDTSAKTEFAFGSNSFRTETAGGLTYVMPDVSATVNSNTNGIRKTTVGGVDIYYPVVSMHKSGSSNWYNYFSIFEAVTITDLNGTVYNTSTAEKPSGLEVMGGFILDANGNISSAESANGTKIFNYATGKEIKCATYSSYGLCYYPDSSFSSSTNSRDEQTIVAKYRYTDSNGTPYYYYVGYWCEKHTKISCVTPDTLVTLADGTQKRIDEITYSDQLLVWDFYKGEYTSAPSSYINNHGYDYNTIISLSFEDGTAIKVSNVHGFYDADLNEFVMISKDNVNEFVGHSFVQQNGNSYKTVKLVSYDIKEEYSESYSLLTCKYYNCIMEGMFSLTASEVTGNLFMPFEVGENMTFDNEKMQADIDEYGLYTYEEFADRLTYEQFIALNIPQIKVAVGKGIVTYEEVLFLLDLHFGG